MQKTEQTAIDRFGATLDKIGFSVPSLICLVILAAAPLFIQNQYILRLLVVSLIFGSQSMAFDFTGGFINAVNFGFAAFVGLGAYASGLLAVKLGVSPWLGLIGGAVVAGAVGFVTGILTLPLRGIYVSLMSWFVGMALMAVATAMVGLTRGAQGLVVPPIYSDVTITTHFYIMLAMTAAIYVTLKLIVRSRIGLAFRAVGQNFEAAAASGVNATRYKLINFTLSCACAGLIGAYYGHFVGILTPDIMDTGHTMEVMALAYVGGSGSLLGGLVTAFLFIPIFDYLKSLMEIRLIIYGMSLVLIMILYPAGLAGLYQKITFAIKNHQKKGEN